MALRFRRDVHKASYYVWFLGAEEAKGFRGPTVITSALSYLIDRSSFQEPLKVTLQVSHKGMKIIQGLSKHFIPHSAITCSIQIGDIAACVLLLYNPETKCPLHVHAYRCDSETTAEALNQQLQTLINRPENQKQFEELERRLGIDISRMISPPVVSEKRSFQFNILGSKKPESSLESTSTRDSECSGSFSAPLSTSSYQKQNLNLFDSLAAELRAKLNGRGAPLLLPPRDYDTVHRSKGNIFRNNCNGNENLQKNHKFFPSPEKVLSEQIRSFENLRVKQNSSDSACLEYIKQINYIDQKNVPEIILNDKNYVTSSKNKPFDKQYKLNLTDKQKHLQLCNKYGKGHENNQKIVYDMQKQKIDLREHHVPLNLAKYRSGIPIQNEYYHHEFEDNPYKQSEKMCHNYRNEHVRPVARRNSFENDIQFNHGSSNDYFQNTPKNYQDFNKNNDSTTNTELSARDRFHGAKEKFRLIERSVSADINNRNNNKYLVQKPVKLETIEGYDDFHHRKLYENKFSKQSNIIKNAKSLSNLNKGYRHSYAEISPPSRISKANEEFKLTTSYQYW